MKVPEVASQLGRSVLIFKCWMQLVRMTCKLTHNQNWCTEIWSYIAKRGHANMHKDCSNTMPTTNDNTDNTMAMCESVSNHRTKSDRLGERGDLTAATKLRNSVSVCCSVLTMSLHMFWHRGFSRIMWRNFRKEKLKKGNLRNVETLGWPLIWKSKARATVDKRSLTSSGGMKKYSHLRWKSFANGVGIGAC